MKSRAWFIVSQSPLTCDSIKLPYKSGIQFIYGGKCSQLTRHYHYVMITNHNFAQSDMQNCNSQFMKIEKVIRSVQHCVTYISQQLVEEPLVCGEPQNTDKESVFIFQKVQKLFNF